MSNNKKSLWLILLLLLALIGISIYAFKQKKELTDLTGIHNELKEEFDAQLQEIEKLRSDNASLETKLADKNAEIERLKKLIVPTINKKTISPKEVVQMTRKIAELTQEIEDYKARVAELEAQVAELQESNAALNNQNQVLTTEKEELEQTVNQAAQIKAVHLVPTFTKKVWFFGNSEKPTKNAAKVSRATLSFYLQNNFLAQSGTKEIYISIIQPNGSVLVDDELKSGKKEIDGIKFDYTQKMVVNYDKNKSNQVTTTFTPDAPMQVGEHEVLIYDHTGATISDRSNFFFTLNQDGQ